MTQSILFTTADGVEIHGIYRNTGQQKIVLLLHMMPATKESWDRVAASLLKEGFASLAIDLRGHGESTMGGDLDYKQFTDGQHQASQADVEAAIAFASEQGFSEENIFLIGASIGANLAIQALQQHPLISKVIALSPGLDYHGIETQPVVSGLKHHQKILLVASDEDVYSWDCIERLHKDNPFQTLKIESSGLGHGTRLLDKNPEMIKQFFSFLNS